MEKQHNRGQDGAGIANIKFDMPPGTRYISRYRSNASAPIVDLFGKIKHRFDESAQGRNVEDLSIEELKRDFPFIGELYLGHLRYGTYGGNSIENCHPFLRQNNWVTRNLILAGNFNMTNVDELFDSLVDIGQHPKEKADTVTILEKIGHFIDESNEKIYRKYKKQGLEKKEISPLIAKEMDLQKILKKSAKYWDGGYAMAGLLGHGDAFVLRDPSGIRPAFYYADNEVVVVASERPVIQTAFNVKTDKIREVKPGHALIIKKDGSFSEKIVNKVLPKMACSFERIYFSRGNDADIYRERIELGKSIVPQVLDKIDHRLDRTVFSFIPNTAEVAFYGMVKGVEHYLDQDKIQKIMALGAQANEKSIRAILEPRPRVDKVAWKDAKMRTFITEDASRDDLVSHVYDITQGVIEAGENLVVLDDSIVRGTTLKQSILKILDRLDPAHIVVVSSAPQIRYPDCYGIDMARLGDFVAFRAAIHLLKKTGREGLLAEVYEKCKNYLAQENPEPINHVKEIYAPFSDEEISDAIAELLTPEEVKAKVSIVFQKVEDLLQACPANQGVWYFTGDFPTPGGMRVVNKAFVNYIEGNSSRAY